ncbi:MAG TPA: hypothetical protein GX736_04000 [Mogibacterium sp.]|nr:hypothetical protein [Mogibacterium sp.]
MVKKYINKAFSVKHGKENLAIKLFVTAFGIALALSIVRYFNVKDESFLNLIMGLIAMTYFIAHIFFAFFNCCYLGKSRLPFPLRVALVIVLGLVAAVSAFIDFTQDIDGSFTFLFVLLFFYALALMYKDILRRKSK